MKNKKISCIQPKDSPKMNALFGAIEEGFPNAIKRNSQADLYVLWGLVGNNFQMMQAYKNQWVFTDMPYHGRFDGEDYENSYWRWCFGGFHDDRKLDVPSDRFEEWGLELKPYQAEGDFILLCPSSETMTRAMYGINQDRWVQIMHDRIKQHTKKPVRVRYKPRKNGTSGPLAETVSFKDDLEGAHAIVTSASLTSIEALSLGVPVFTDTTHNPAAWCAEMDFSYLNTPNKYSREELFNNLAYKQYSIKEYRNGTAYENIYRHLHN